RSCPSTVAGKTVIQAPVPVAAVCSLRAAGARLRRASTSSRTGSAVRDERRTSILWSWRMALLREAGSCRAGSARKYTPDIGSGTAKKRDIMRFRRSRGSRDRREAYLRVLDDRPCRGVRASRGPKVPRAGGPDRELSAEERRDGDPNPRGRPPEGRGAQLARQADERARLHEVDERRKLGKEANIAEEGGADHDLVKRHGPERRPPPPDSPAHPCACRQEPKRNREHPLPVGREHVDRSSQALEPSGPVRGAEPERFGLEPDSE